MDPDRRASSPTAVAPPEAARTGSVRTVVELDGSLHAQRLRIEADDGSGAAGGDLDRGLVHEGDVGTSNTMPFSIPGVAAHQRPGRLAAGQSGARAHPQQLVLAAEERLVVNRPYQREASVRRDRDNLGPLTRDLLAEAGQDEQAVPGDPGHALDERCRDHAYDRCQATSE